MSLINGVPLTELAVFKLRQHIDMSIQQMAVNFKKGFDMVWNRTDGVTPQQVLDGLGTSATELFIRSAATRDHIIAMRPELLPEEYRTPPLPVVFNNDGTVTVQEG